LGIKITSKWLTNLQSLHENTANYVHSSIYGRNRSFQIMSYRSGFGGPKPVEMGKEYEVEISEVSTRGDGIARIQGFVIFVEGAKTGQKTKIRITSVGDRFAKAQVVN
jgi:predicted RNA-binding protein with TRAM domain